MSPAGAQHLPNHDLVEHATCLGCGCACDDIAVRVADAGIVETINTCSVGAAWFGNGRVPAAVRANGREVSVDTAIDAVIEMLAASRAPLVYLAPEVSCECQRAAVALADRLRATLDTVTSVTASRTILAAQERGRPSATLGEIRNRADLMVFWGVDPNVSHPRYWTRYAPEPAGMFVERGRAGRRVIAVDIDDAHGPADADVRVAASGAEEVAMLTAIASVVHTPTISFDEPLGARAASLARELTTAKYVAIVADGEPSSPPGRDPQRAAALIALAHALNGPTRCALSTLRGGGNRTGADTVLTSQTGYPMRVSFSMGFPVYRPHDTESGTDAVLVVGDAAQIPSAALPFVATTPLAIIGPRASGHHDARVTIDTGVAGIHLAGTAIRMDDIPVPLRASMTGPPDPAEILRIMLTRLAGTVPMPARRGGSAR